MADLDELLQQLHSETAQQLLEKVRSGSATASDLNVARQFLKDNNIESIPKAGSPEHNLAQELPFDADADDDTVVPFQGSGTS